MNKSKKEKGKQRKSGTMKELKLENHGVNEARNTRNNRKQN